MSYLGALAARITIGALRFRYVTEVQLESGWNELTDRATLKLPRRLQLKGTNIELLMKVGDPVTVELGYDTDLATEFVGFLAEIKPSSPLELMCEDAMWLLKQHPVTGFWPKPMLSTLLAEILPATVPFVLRADVQLGPVRATRSTAAKLLEEIRRAYGFAAYIRAGKLYVGTVSAVAGTTDRTPRRWPVSFQGDVVEHQLIFRRSSDVKLNVTAVSILPTGQKLEVKLGDPEGEARSLLYYDLSLADLTARANEELGRLKYDGYRGALTTFGTVKAVHGDVLVLQDNEFPERNGAYYVDRVGTAFSTGGGLRKTFTLGMRAA